MYSNISRVLLIIFSFFLSSVKAEDDISLSTNTSFSVQPQQCVTLRQGRNCYATLTIQWQKSTEQSLCLHQVNTKQNNSEKKLFCWPKSNKGETSVLFESSDNLTYQLRTLKDEKLIAETEMVVSWVHKNTARKRRWRLF